MAVAGVPGKELLIAANEAVEPFAAVVQPVGDALLEKTRGGVV